MRHEVFWDFWTNWNIFRTFWNCWVILTIFDKLNGQNIWIILVMKKKCRRMRLFDLIFKHCVHERSLNEGTSTFPFTTRIYKQKYTYITREKKKIQSLSSFLANNTENSSKTRLGCGEIFWKSSIWGLGRVIELEKLGQSPELWHKSRYIHLTFNTLS